MNLNQKVILKYVGMLLSCTPSAAYCEEFATHFREVRWYDTINVVREKETSPFVEYRQEESNIAVDPPTPFQTEHLYYADTLLGKPVLVHYKFDLDCKQLFEGGYIFEEILNSRAIDKLIRTIEHKYAISMKDQILDNKHFSYGNLNNSTKVGILEFGRLHYQTNKTIIYFRSTNAHMNGWREGKKPECSARMREVQELHEKL